MATEYSLALVSAGYTAALGVITAGAGASTIGIFSAADVLLASATIDDAASAVSGTTGDITIAIAAQEDSSPAGGTASYAQIIDGDGDPHIQVPCVQGTEAVAGFCVLNTLVIIAGAPLEILSVVIPAPALLA
ncbi:hypothetical protein [Endozoicomonas sp. 4G]|uniref:hypothetical protein n=1 Tax=Endozoicomonas sp. 4G TaxID=2872754 RepID=UPI0020788D62|nr:hypothetical protein [Endozoicomonas sp. 4G]